MARAAVDVVGDSASAVRALDQTAAAAIGAGDGFKKLAVDADAAAAAITRANATRAEGLLAQAAALRQVSAGSASTIEQAAASEAAVRKQTQAYRLLGLQAVETQASLARTAGTVGRGLTTFVTAPAAFIGYEAVKQAIDFNQQMLLIRTQAGDTTDSIRQLSGAVLDLAKVAPQGPVQLSEGLFHLVSLGLRGAQAMSTLREASLAAGMGIADIQDTTTALGAAVVAGIKGATDYQRAMATLVATAGSGNVRFGDLAASVGNVLPAAATAGITLREMGAALAVMTDRGFSADEAATRLRYTLALIERPSKAATKALADMGVNADQLGVMLRQPDGLLKVLETLQQAVASVGVVRGNRDLLEAFGGARSGIGIQTLVQSLSSAVSSYQGKLQLIGEQQRQFAANQQLYLESPAYKLHAALSTVEADLVRLGQSLTPVVVGLGGTVKTIADTFDALPGFVKTDIGVIVGILAVGGPIALAAKGIATLVSGIGDAFALLPGRAAPAIGELDGELATLGATAERTGLMVKSSIVLPPGVVATTEGELAGIGASSSAAAGKVSVLAGALKGIAAIGVITVTIDVVRRILSGGPSNLNPFTTETAGMKDLIRRAEEATVAYDRAHHLPIPGAFLGPLGGLPPGITPNPAAPTTGPFAETGPFAPPHPRATTRPPFTVERPPPPISTFKLPTSLQIAIDQAQAGYGNLQKATENARDWVLRFVQTHHLTQAALEQAWAEIDSLTTKAAASTHKAAAAAKRAIVDDQLLAKARLDLAQGETGAAQLLLKQDQQRLARMLAQATTGEQRLAIQKQLAEVERLRHTKSDAFQLPLALQVEMARADALAALTGATGPTRLQFVLARKAKADAMKAIESHVLTMQGLIAAWQQVQQDDSVLAQARGAVNTYHAVSTATLTQGLGLSRAADLTLRERLAQAEAHRGFAPRGVGVEGQVVPMVHDVHVKVTTDWPTAAVKIEKHQRGKFQRSGGRR